MFGKVILILTGAESDKPLPPRVTGRLGQPTV